MKLGRMRGRGVVVLGLVIASIAPPSTATPRSTLTPTSTQAKTLTGAMRDSGPLALPERLPPLPDRPAPHARTRSGVTQATSSAAWQARYSSESASWEIVTAVAADQTGDRVFAISSSTGRDSGYDIVTAGFDAVTGAERWRARFDLAVDTDVANAIAVAPDGSRVYVAGYSYADGAFRSIAVAYDAASGAELWRLVGDGLDASDNGAFAIDAGSSTVIVAGTVSGWPGATKKVVDLNASWSFLAIALDAATGEIRWRRTLPGGHVDVARAVKIASDRAIISGISFTAVVGTTRTTALDLTTGLPMWEARAPGGSRPELAVGGSTAFVGGEGGAGGFVLAYDTASGAELWRSTRAEQSVALATSGGRVFAATTSGGLENDAVAVALDGATGAELWSTRYTRPGHQLTAGLTVSQDGERVLLAGSTEDGPRHVFVRSHDASSGVPGWTAIASATNPHSDVATSIAASGGQIFVGASSWGGRSLEDESVLALDANGGGLDWRTRYDGPGNYGYEAAGASALSHSENTLFVAGPGTDGGVRWTTVAYEAETGASRWTATQAGPVDDQASGIFGESPRAIAVSPDDARVFVTGRALVARAGSTGIVYSSNWMTAGYDAATGTRLWAVGAPGVPNLSGPAGIAVSPDGQTVYVGGMRWSGFPWTGGTSGDFELVAYDAASGAIRWQTTWNEFDERPSVLALSPDGSRVFMAGMGSSSELGYHYVAAAFDTTTHELVWRVRTGTLSNFFSSVTGIDVAADGSRLYITGGREIPSATDAVILRSITDTVAFDASDGSIEWSAQDGDPGVWSDGVDLKLSPDGARVYVAARTIPHAATASSFFAVGNNVLALAYDATSGALVWRNEYDSSIDGNVTLFPDDLPWALAVTPADRVFVTGMSFNGSSGWDFLTLSYDGPTGAIDPARRLDGPSHGEDIPYTAEAGSAGVYVSGASWNAGSSFDFLTVAYPAE